jgi:hypothetical protein
MPARLWEDFTAARSQALMLNVRVRDAALRKKVNDLPRDT